MDALYARDGDRAACLTFCRDTFTRIGEKGNTLHKTHIDKILADRDLCDHLFRLFDTKAQGGLIQEEWISMMKENLRHGNKTSIHHLRGTAKPPRMNNEAFVQRSESDDIIELLEAVAYLVCQDDPIRVDDFYKIMSSRGIPAKILRLADYNSDGVVSIEEMMSFIILITNPRNRNELTIEKLKYIEQVFREHLPRDKQEFTLAEFKKLVPSKNPFFVERSFRIFDRDGNGSVSLAEFIDTLHQFAGQTVDEKIVFLFKVYDLDDDGLIQQSDLREVMKACMEENGMKFDDKEIEDLASALYEDAVGLATQKQQNNNEYTTNLSRQVAISDTDVNNNLKTNGNKNGGRRGITVEDLKAEIEKHEGLLENLSINIGKWLVPPTPPQPKPFFEKFRNSLPHQFSLMYIKNNMQFISFLLLFIVIINIVLFISRAYYFKDFYMLNGYKPNYFYVLSRANGRVLLYNSMMILVLVLRKSITALRVHGLASILPLDHNIYLHKLLGFIIFFQSYFHTIMHLFNFALNVQPDPIRFAQMTSKYWEEFGPVKPGWLNLDYELPDKCYYELNMTICTQFISGYDDPTILKTEDYEVTGCQVCPEVGEKYSYYEWIMTSKPHLFGLMPGWANPTGVGLITILTVMVICSLPFVRRGGYFEVFYFSHLLYWGYNVLLILHAPEYWKWIIAPGIMFIMELFTRILSYLMGKGKTTIQSAIVLPSRVTCLIVKRPHNFNFAPGDWVYIKVPEIAKSEWHPFTISSAPEQEDYFTLHIRGVGQWTNRLYSYFENFYKKEMESRENSSGMRRLRGTMHRKYTNMKKKISMYSRNMGSDEANPDFQAIASRWQLDPARSQERMRKRQQKLQAQENMGYVVEEEEEEDDGEDVRCCESDDKQIEKDSSIKQYDSQSPSMIRNKSTPSPSHLRYRRSTTSAMIDTTSDGNPRFHKVETFNSWVESVRKNFGMSQCRLRVLS